MKLATRGLPKSTLSECQERRGDAARKISENTQTCLKIRGEKAMQDLFPVSSVQSHEKVTLKLPRQIALVTQGVNGSVNVGEIDGPVEVHGVNGKVDIAQATGSAEFHGINGNISVALTRLEKEAVSLKGVNGNIELRLAEGINVELEAHGMNGRVCPTSRFVVMETTRKRSCAGRHGEHSANGSNGNIRLSGLPPGLKQTQNN